jgi:CheY-like chemotaxis protein
MTPEQIKILVVDDDVISTIVTSKNLERFGFNQVKSCHTGNEALTLVADFNPHIIFMDIRLQGDLNGIQTAEIIRKKDATPILFFSGTVDPNEIKLTKKIANTKFFDRLTDFAEIQQSVLEFTK